jgi:hypothetical protein
MWLKLEPHQLNMPAVVSAWDTYQPGEAAASDNLLLAAAVLDNQPAVLDTQLVGAETQFVVVEP